MGYFICLKGKSVCISLFFCGYQRKYKTTLRLFPTKGAAFQTKALLLPLSYLAAPYSGVARICISQTFAASSLWKKRTSISPS